MTADEKMKSQIMRCLVGACDETCGYYNYSDDICDAPLEEMHEFLAKASKALEKQIPIRPEWHGQVYRQLFCKCGHQIDNGLARYCSYCGQRLLNWSEEE